jgi:transcriptional regulator with XRE-family HTH domain
MKLGQRIAALRNKKHLTQDQMAEILGVKRGRYNAWENGIANPDVDMLAAIAKYHKVTVDFILGLPHPEGVNMLTQDMYADGYTDQSVFQELEERLKSSLSQKDERDIATDLERMINDLESNEALAFHGEPMDDQTKELMRLSLENSLRLAKGMAKKKFTPNKHKQQP